MAQYTIEPERRTLHGHFSRDLAPVLTIEPGDTVVYRTLDAGWGLEATTALDVERRHFEPRVKGRDDGHALCGPVAIRGAEPGMTLEIRINEVVLGSHGATFAGFAGSEINRRLGVDDQEIVIPWTLDSGKMVGHSPLGYSLPLSPFMGVMGMPPDEPGVLPTAPPRVCGGNIDCKELVAGSTLYLPIAVPGALFSVGDGHGAQGDGEACGTAIECPMDRVSLTFDLHPEMRLRAPRALTANAWLTFGFHEDLDEAMLQAVDGMLGLMGELHGMGRTEALALASLVVDLRITQVVNGVRGVHAVLPHGVLGSPGAG
jgi:acetamidase/formamidase